MKRSAIRRKRPMARGSKGLARKSRPRRKKRSAAEYRRIYGSPERVRWMKALPCHVCGRGPCDTCHVGNGGRGRKAGYAQTIPLCTVGCARKQTDLGWSAIGLTKEGALVAAALYQLAWTALDAA